MNPFPAQHCVITTPARTSSKPWRGFTLLELIVVIVMMLTLLALAIPAFVALKRDSERSSAWELVRQTIRDAHNLARDGGSDAGVAFTYDPATGTQCLVIRKLGSMLDLDVTNAPVSREVFVPVDGRKATTLPGGISVRGYVPPDRITREWYERYDAEIRYNITVTGTSTTSEPTWVFPETDFYSRLVANTTDDVGRDRQTFIVRFEAGSGRLVSSEATPGLLVLPRPSNSGRTSALAKEENLFDPSSATVQVNREAQVGQSLASRVKGILGRGAWIINNTLIDGKTARLQLLGDASSDTVLVRAVSRLAIYRERELASAIGVEPNRNSGCLYDLPDNYQTYTNPANSTTRPVFPRYVSGLRLDANTPRIINRWIEGFTDIRSTTSTVQSFGSNAAIFTVQPARGDLTEETQQ